MSVRSGIPKAYAKKLNELLIGSGDYINNIYESATNKVVHFSDVQNYPTITVTPGPETREDMPSRISIGTLRVYFRIYVSDEEDAQGELESLISDVETFLDTNQRIEFTQVSPGGDITANTIRNSIVTISTDEGVLDPQALGEVVVEVEYEKQRKI